MLEFFIIKLIEHRKEFLIHHAIIVKVLIENFEDKNIYLAIGFLDIYSGDKFDMIITKKIVSLLVHF